MDSIPSTVHRHGSDARHVVDSLKHTSPVEFRVPYVESEQEFLLLTVQTAIKTHRLMRGLIAQAPAAPVDTTVIQEHTS